MRAPTHIPSSPKHTPPPSLQDNSSRKGIQNADQPNTPRFEMEISHALTHAKANEPCAPHPPNSHRHETKYSKKKGKKKWTSGTETTVLILMILSNATHQNTTAISHRLLAIRGA
jgi:hypothetical protein